MIERNKLYSQVNSILEELGEEYYSKLPKEIYELIQNSKDSNYNPKYDISKSLKNQGVSKEALSLICDFQIRYWCKDENDLRKLKNFLKENDETVVELNNTDNTNTEMTVYKENILDSVLLKFLNL